MKPTIRSAFAPTAFFCLASLVMGQTAAQQMPRPACTRTPSAPIDLGTLGGSNSQANAISLFGAITGQANLSGDNAYHAFLREPHSGLIDLGTLPGGVNSVGTGANFASEVVGYSDYLDPETGLIATHPFLHTRAGIIDLGTLGGYAAQATAINNRGAAVGYSLLSDNATTHAFAYFPKTKSLADLGVLDGGINSAAYSVNDFGIAAGYSDTGNVDSLGNPITDAALFNISTKKITDLGNLGASPAQALAINDFGRVVGFSAVPDGSVHAFYWEAGKMTDIGGLGGSFTQATAISVFGEVVGLSNTTGDAEQHAFVWTKKAGMIDLNSVLPANSGWVLNAAYGVNFNGEIVGVGTFNGESHAFAFTYFVD